MGRVRRERENYISKATEVNRSQKAHAKEAVLWLLARGPHTEEEISEHFGLSADVVSLLAEELIKTGRIQRQARNQRLLALRDPFKKTCK